MRTRQRLEGLKQWFQKELCEGRKLKAPGKTGDITEIVRQQPECYIGWQPIFPDRTGQYNSDPISVCPGIVIMPKFGYAKYVEEQRFDRYKNVNRPQEVGQDFNIDVLFSVYEPGVRLPGFVDSANSPEGFDLSKIMEGTEQGIFTLADWMDDCVEKLLGVKTIPGTDLALQEHSTVRSLYSDQSYIVDKRPIFYGFVSVGFKGYAIEAKNPEIEEMIN